jgi:GGDEF domain-containing protein
LPEGKPVEEALQRMLLQPEWSLVTIRITGLDGFRAGRGFPVADDLMRELASVLQSTAAERLKVGVIVGHLAFDELVILSDQPTLFDFAKEMAGCLRQKAQSFYPLLPQTDSSGSPSELAFHFRILSSADGSYPTWDALQNALEQTPPRTL